MDAALALGLIVSAFIAGRVWQWVRDVNRGIGPKRDGGQR